MAGRHEMLVFGYVRDNEQEMELSMTIPDAIYNEIYQWYPRLLPFHHSNIEDAFKLSEDGLEVTGNDRDHGGYCIYAKREEMNGYSNGVHYWSVKSNVGQDDDFCYRYIGVTTKYDAKNSYELKFSEPIDKCQLCPSKSEHWLTGQTYSLRLDLDNGLVTGFKNGEHYNERKLNLDRTWYFVALYCSMTKNTKYEIVDTPLSVYKYKPNIK